MMHKMLKLICAGVAATAIVFLSGCVSAPGDYKYIAGKDDVQLSQEVKDFLRRSEQRFKVAVLPESESYRNKYVKKYELNRLVGDKLEHQCSKLSTFDVIARQELDVVLDEQDLNNLSTADPSIQIEKIDAALLYYITSCALNSDYFITTDYDLEKNKLVKKRVRKYRASVTLSISMVDPQTQGKTFSEVVEGESSWQDENAPDLLMREAIDLALDEFMKKMAYHFYQRGYVIQTVGGGRWAKISLSAEAGIRPNTQVEFCITDINGQILPFAYGEVREVNNKDSWVMVYNYKDANVRNNTLVRVSSNQKRDFAQQLADTLGLIYGAE